MELTYDKAKELMEQFMPNSFTGTYDGDNFLVVESWNEIETVTKELPEDMTFDEFAEIITNISNSWGFSDTYWMCSDCNEIINKDSDNYWLGDGEIVCSECVSSDRKMDYIDYLINNVNSANRILEASDLEEAGFTELEEEYECGYYGRADSPSVIYEELKNKNDVIFNITSAGNPFCTTFTVWVKPFED